MRKPRIKLNDLETILGETDLKLLTTDQNLCKENEFKIEI